MPAPLKRRKALSKRPRKWTPVEERRLLTMLRGGKCALPALRSAFGNRNDASIRSKVRKLRVKHDLFGDAYREKKTAFSEKIAAATKPRTVFEAYAGAGHQTLAWAAAAAVVYAAERNATQARQFAANVGGAGFRERKLPPKGWTGWRVFQKGGRKIFLHPGDATDAAVSLRRNNVKIGLLDMDTCGSAIPALPLFLHLLRPTHLVITHGEFLSYRFGRKDVLRRILCHRNVNDSRVPRSPEALEKALIQADKISALRCANETERARWLVVGRKESMGNKAGGMLRVHYRVIRPPATADCLNELAGL